MSTQTYNKLAEQRHVISDEIQEIRSIAEHVRYQMVRALSLSQYDKWQTQWDGKLELLQRVSRSKKILRWRDELLTLRAAEQELREERQEIYNKIHGMGNAQFYIKLKVVGGNGFTIIDRARYRISGRLSVSTISLRSVS